MSVTVESRVCVACGLVYEPTCTTCPRCPQLAKNQFIRTVRAVAQLRTAPPELQAYARAQLGW
jgi:hypothetical protein